MKYKMIRVKVSLDSLAMRSDSRKGIQFDPRIIKSHKLRRGIPLKEKSSPHYAFVYDYTHKRTKNKVSILAHMRGKDYYVPNLFIKFFSSWDHPLSYREVVEVLNTLTAEYNVGFEVSKFHLAIDLFSDIKDYYLHSLAGCVKSGRKVEPELDPDHPTTYRWHDRKSAFCQELYDKRQQLIDANKPISPRSRKQLKRYNVYRFELKFNNAFMGSCMPTLPALATTDFSSLYPSHLEFLQPDPSWLEELDPIEAKKYGDLSLEQLREVLERKHKVESNLFYYLADNPSLSEPVLKALRKYRWCRHPDKYRLIEPRLTLTPPPVKFIKQ